MSHLRRQFLGRVFLAGTAAVPTTAAASEQPRRSVPSRLPVDALVYASDASSRRASSADPTNYDRTPVEPGATLSLADIRGAGCIRHIWLTGMPEEPDYLRRVILRAFWDGESTPSVETPLGDFFGVGHARVSNYWSEPLNIVTGGSHQQHNRAGFNCYFPMPFSSGARLTLENQGSKRNAFYWYVDYETFPALADGALRFHAQWRRQYPERPAVDASSYATRYDSAREAEYRRTGKLDLTSPDRNLRDIPNPDGRLNYTLLAATGRGHYVGCSLSVDNIAPLPGIGWFGEGDDMIFLDGEPLPSIRGTGTEDYFCAAWGYPAGQHSTPYHGVSLAGEPGTGPLPYAGKWSMYRFHILDPIRFRKSIRVTIEMGHANIQANDYSSVAYWYQDEPHAAFPPMPPVDQRLPIPDAESLRRFRKAL